MIELKAGLTTGLEGMEIRHREALGDGCLFACLFESLGGASFLYPWDALHPQYGWQPGGSFGYDMDCPGNSEHPLRVSVRARPVSPNRLELITSLTNRSDRFYTHCWTDMCLMFRYAPLFADHSGERCILDTSSGPVAADRWPRQVWDESWSPRVQAYRVEGVVVPYPYGVVQGLAMWSISPATVRSGCIMMQRADGQWSIGLVWDRVASVAHNPDDEHHCIHSDAWFGTLAPRSAVTRRGALFFVEGPPEALLECYRVWLED